MASITAVQRTEPSSQSRKMFFRFELPAQNRTRLLDALEARVTEKLKTDRCRIGGGGSGGVNKRLILYRRGPIDGGFEGWMRDVGDDSIALILHIHEQRGRLYATEITNDL